MANKNAFVAYLLWLIGGFVGLHHLYLGRDRHAFITWATLGGVFGLGFLRDFTRLGDYVDDANDDPAYMEELIVKMRRKHPPFNVVRFFAQVAVGWLFSALTASAIPSDLLEKYTWLHFVVPYACAIGVNLVGNIGREQTSIYWAAIGAYGASPFYFKDHSDFTYMSFFSSALVTFKGKEWRRTYGKKRHLCKRLFILGACATLYLSLWGSAFYHNAYVTTGDGEKVRLRDAIDNFFHSQAWKDFKKTGWELYAYYQKHGWEKMWEELVIAVDPEGEEHSYSVLDLPSSASEEDVTKAYRQLVKKWHPDKVKDPALKEEAAQKFMEIQKAYETLSTIKSRRANRQQSRRN